MAGKLLEGKVALVTGGSSGIGRAISLRYAAEGAHVVVADLQRDPRDGGEPTDALVARHGVEGRFVRCEVTSRADVEAAVAATDQLGGLDVLVACAGIFRRGSVFDVTEADYELMMDINVKGVFFSAQAAASRIRERGGGCIITLSSVAGMQGSAGSVTYCASKGAVRLMTYALAQELGEYGIRVNAIHPGLVQTTMTTVDVPVIGTEREEAVIASLPLGRVAQPDDVAGIAVFLASDLGGYVSGASVRVDGGMLRV